MANTRGKKEPVGKREPARGPGAAATESSSAYINERGELCFGDSCIRLASVRGGVRIRVDESRCDPDTLKVIRQIKQQVVDGDPTLYSFGKPPSEADDDD